MITVHHLRNSRSHRVLWLLEELGADYAITRYEREPETMPALARPVVRTLAKSVIESFVQPQIQEHLQYVERELAASAWFAGDAFTAADVHMSFPIEIAATGGWLDGRHARTKEYVQRIRE